MGFGNELELFGTVSSRGAQHGLVDSIPLYGSKQVSAWRAKVFIGNSSHYQGAIQRSQIRDNGVIGK